jgi:hypothetical protein
MLTASASSASRATSGKPATKRLRTPAAKPGLFVLPVPSVVCRLNLMPRAGHAGFSSATLERGRLMGNTATRAVT